MGFPGVAQGSHGRSGHLLPDCSRLTLPRDQRQPGGSCMSKGGAPPAHTRTGGVLERGGPRGLLLGAGTPCPLSPAQAFSGTSGTFQGKRHPFPTEVSLGSYSVSPRAGAPHIGAESPYQPRSRLPTGISSADRAQDSTSPLPKRRSWVKIRTLPRRVAWGNSASFRCAAPRGGSEGRRRRG